MEKFFNAEEIMVKGWEGLTTQQIGRAIERYITEREEKGFKVCKVIWFFVMLVDIKNEI